MIFHAAADAAMRHRLPHSAKSPSRVLPQRGIYMEIGDLNQQIGRKIRDLRDRNGLTQQELADRAELTKGFISQLERGQVSPSLESLFDLIEILGSTPAEFFGEGNADQVVFTKKDYFEKTEENGCTRTWIVPNAQKFQMEPILVRIEPHTELEEDKPHNGEEFGYVLSGRVNVCLGDKVYHVKAGESFYYQADCRHQLKNPGAVPAKVLWISTPPEF